MSPSPSPTPKIVIANPGSPSHPSDVLESQFRENSLQGEPDDRTPLLENHPDQRIKPSSRSRRWRDFSHKKLNVIVGLLSVFLVVVIVLAFISWRLFDKESSARGGNRTILVHAKHGAVATELDSCSNIGINILQEGGNAVDAAIASAICIGSINMFSSGIGGLFLTLVALIVEAGL